MYSHSTIPDRLPLAQKVGPGRSGTCRISLRGGVAAILRRVPALPAKTTTRRLWQVIEPVHAVLYFAPELTTEATKSGLAGHGSTYFACRAAPLGQATAALVTAVFYGFSPTRVRRSVPAMWELVDPTTALHLRTTVADAALRRLLGPVAASPMVARAAELADRAVGGAEMAGRPLAAANAALEVEGDPHIRLWQALTTLREHRGDGHCTALVNAGIRPGEAHVLRAGSGAVEPEFLRTSRGWSQQEWADVAQQLRIRGWLSSDGRLTPSGTEIRDAYESDTDRLAASPFEALGPERTEELRSILRQLANAIVAAGGVPIERGLGSPWPPRDSL